jgi:hypothetical protein
MLRRQNTFISVRKIMTDSKFSVPVEEWYFEDYVPGSVYVR